MTDPGDIPAHTSQLWSTPGCSVPGCVQEAATVDGIRGRRCTDHKPTFDPAKAVEIAVNGLPGAAGAYVRAVEG